ncbi:class I SAM-dependent methyltransferase [Amycolatopsis sp. NPDC059021]|uniref:class I SAM-dependent methyltransferase n=1 Tax=Amycolatopsis sp. NPDC059021 TaxID=3346704 RepID=UPI00366D2329
MKNQEITRERRKLVPEMGGPLARMYARQRGTEPQLAAWRKQAAEMTAGLPGGADILEVAFGPGYFAVELARLGFSVTGLDVAPTFVELANEHAAKERLRVDFRQGDVAAMPLEDESFDFVVCQAAFKNFTRPVDALDEMHRVLRPGGIAVVQDLNHEAAAADVDREVVGMDVGRVAGFAIRHTLGGMLRRRAYSPERFRLMVARSAFETCEITTPGIGIEVTLRK